jgi:hypothetical protein
MASSKFHLSVIPVRCRRCDHGSIAGEDCEYCLGLGAHYPQAELSQVLRLARLLAKYANPDITIEAETDNRDALDIYSQMLFEARLAIDKAARAVAVAQQQMRNRLPPCQGGTCGDNACCSNPNCRNYCPF